MKKKDTKAQKKRLEKELDVAWSKYVRNRDKKCQKCGSQSASLSSHHAFGRRHMATRWDVNNGVGLCYPCHIRWAHGDPSGFTEWFRQKIGDEKYIHLALEHDKIAKYDCDALQTMLDWFWRQA
jgi:5-methylcytosine-specific restriction endonuclease McrA